MWLSLVEHHVRDVGAASSNLVTSTKKSRVSTDTLFFYQDLNLRASFRKSEETDFREEHSANVPIKSGKQKSPRQKSSPKFCALTCFFCYRYFFICALMFSLVFSIHSSECGYSLNVSGFSRPPSNVSTAFSLPASFSSSFSASIS